MTALLAAHEVGRRFTSGNGWFGAALFGGGHTVRALHGISLTVDRAEIVALVGESGSGKSTLGRILARLDTPSEGEVRLGGEALGARAWHQRVQMVLQDPFASLNPAHPVIHHVERPLRLRAGGRRSGGDLDVPGRARALLASVGLPPELSERLPRALSGGQRQRVAIARALATDPELLIADEPTSMLDVSLRAGILDLLVRARDDRGLACVFITHDLGGARAVADRVLVLYAGILVEEGPTEALLAAPAHPYTALLLAAARGGRSTAPLPARPGLAPVVDPGPGCPFAARCRVATERCAVLPAETALGDGRKVRCHHPLALPTPVPPAAP